MPDPAPSSGSIQSLRRLALVIGTTALSAAGLALVAAACWYLVPPVSHDAAFVASHAVLDGFFYARQPAKTLAFQACVLAAPLLVALAIFLVRGIVAHLDAVALRRWIVAGLVLDFLLFAACLRPLLYDPHPPLWMPPAWLLCPLPFPPPVPAWEWIGSILAGLALILWLRVKPSGRQLRRRVTGLILAFALLLAPVEFYAPSQITDQFDFTYHLNAMLDALSQSINGHHLLVDFPHIYGGYGELMAPVLRLFPRTMAVPLIALALPTLLAIFGWLLTACLTIRRPGLLALTGWGLLAVSYLMAVPPTYIYGTPRGFFPALGLLLAALYFRRPSRGRYGAVSVLAALATIWNLDTGLVFWLAWTLTLLAGEAARRDWIGILKRGAFQGAILIMAWTAFILYLRIVSHQWPDLRLLVHFQALVVEAGYFCVALVVPSAWVFLLLPLFDRAGRGHLRASPPPGRLEGAPGPSPLAHRHRHVQLLRGPVGGEQPRLGLPARHPAGGTAGRHGPTPACAMACCHRSPAGFSSLGRR